MIDKICGDNCPKIFLFRLSSRFPQWNFLQLGSIPEPISRPSWAWAKRHVKRAMPNRRDGTNGGSFAGNERDGMEIAKWASQDGLFQ
jgi:hypothetical protein